MRAKSQTRRLGLVVAALGCLSSQCAKAEDEFFGAYFARREGVTAGVGDAKAVNSAAQIIDPWPPHVANRNIPGNGERMSGAIERYQNVQKLKESAPPISSATSSTSTTAASTR